MREKPDIPDELLRSILQDQYNLVPITLEFLPVGLDYHAGVYREAQYLHSRHGESISQRTLLEDWLAHQATIHMMLNSLEKLAGVLQKQSGPYVFCHADLHPANLIRDTKGNVFVIDWDDVMLAPKERDFIFIREPEADAFWEGYGQPQIDWIALTYYRCERVVQDVIACAHDMFFKEDLGEETRADIAELFHEILLGSTSSINDIYTAAAYLPADLTL